MNYPVWDVPHLGNGMVIALIAVFHIMIAHFAVGGGLYLAMAEYRALRLGRRDWMEFLPMHSKFFLILTGVFGAVSGVGIWFSIGLAAPEATSSLIHNFVFGWAIEWVFFLIELTAAAVYYYTWDRIPERLHLRVGWLYAAASLATLVIINGILTFMLTPGQAWLQSVGTGTEPSLFFRAFFNPTYWPSVLLRVLSCASLAGVWALITGSLINGREKPELKTDVIRWSIKWLVPGFLLLPFGLIWYLAMIPDAQRQLIELGVSTIGQGMATQVTRTVLISVMASSTILAVCYLAAYRNPIDFRFGYACVVLLLALAATGTAEQAREMLRKPYVIVDYMYSNAVRRLPVQRHGELVDEIAKFNQQGYLAETIWLTETQRRKWAKQNVGAKGPVDSEVLLRGRLMFRGQCMACHTINGYRSMKRLVGQRDRQAILRLLGVLHEAAKDSPYRAYMPPLVGTEGEIAALAAYLDKIAHNKKEAPGDEPVAQTANKR